MGRRPLTLSEAQLAEVETLAAVLTAEQLADYFGIGRTTFFALMNRDPAIAERYKRGKARAIGAIAQSLITKARAGDTASMIFYLKTQGGWRETSGLAHSIDPTPPDRGGTGAERLGAFLDAIAARVPEDTRTALVTYEAAPGPSDPGELSRPEASALRSEGA